MGQSRRRDSKEWERGGVGGGVRWATIERLPTYDRLRKGMLKQVLDSGSIRYEEVDVANLVV